MNKKTFQTLLYCLGALILLATGRSSAAYAQGPANEDLVRPVLQHPFQDQVLYFAIPDRFNDAVEANNCGAYTGPCVENDTRANVLTHGYLPGDKGYYHGGDLQGLRARLDYLADMGVTAVWVGPIYKNKSVQVDSSNLYGHSSAYHGYWIEDFLQVDPHLGTNQEFKALVQEAHDRDIQIFMDIITNHTADIIQLENNAGYRSKTEFPYLDANDNEFNDSLFAYSGQPGYTFPPVDLTTFPYTPTIPAAEQGVKNPAWLNDPLLYHNRGDSSFVGENSLYGDFFGLDDLWTERKEVVDGMIDIYKFWIEEFDVDGFRIDTTKHVNIEFWQKFGPDILEAAEAEGIDHFFAFGEVFDQQFGAPFLSYFSTTGELQATIDFAFQIAARDFASQSSATHNLRDFFLRDDYYIDADSNPYIQPTFLGNHDMGRIGYFLQRVDQTGAGDAELLARSKLAHGLMFFARGQPVIYYGDEQGFTGDGGDKDAREDMFANAVPVYEDNDLIGTGATTSEDNFDPTHPLYQAFQEYAAIYHNHLALRRGAQIHRYSTDEPGVYAFSRIERDEKVEYIVAFNNSEPAGATAQADETVSIPTFYPAGTLFALVYDSQTKGSGLIYLPIISQNSSLSQPPEQVDSSAHPAALTTNAQGNLTITVPALNFVIYKAITPIPDSNAAPNISISNLTNNQTVDLEIQSLDGHEMVERLEVEAALNDDNIYAEVTFAVKVNDGEYEPIGTDDNPPYRILYDLNHLRDEEGLSLSFKAIVNDLSGHIKGTEVTGVTPNIIELEPPSETIPYAVIHYNRPLGDYGDHTTGDFNDFWGLHLWGEGIPSTEATDWTDPKPFLGQDEYGRFAWVELTDASKDVNFIVHKGDTKDGTQDDRKFNPAVDGPEIWLKADDGSFYTSQAEAQGFVTIHYHRADDDYGDLNSSDFNDFWGLHLWGDGLDPTEVTDWTAPKKPDGFDDYGAFFNIQIQDASQPVNFIVHRGDVKDPVDSPDRSFNPLETASIWLQSGDVTVYPQRGAAEGVATIHYHRPDGDYGDSTSSDFTDFWGLHVWDGAANPTDWTDPIRWDSLDLFGPVFKIDLVDNAPNLAYIIHKGDDKDPGPDQRLVFDKWGYEVWQLSGEGPDPDQPHYVLPIIESDGGGVNPGDLSQEQAYWVDEDTIAWETADDASLTYELHYAADGGLTAAGNGITGSDGSLTLTPGALSNAVKDKFPHLADLPALKISSGDLGLVPDMLKGQVAVSALDSEGNPVDATGLQIPGVLDDLYTYNGPLGVSYSGAIPTLRLWAPTAKSVTLHRFETATSAPAAQTVAMTAGPNGVWSAPGEASWTGDFYLYEVEVYAPSTGQVETNMVTDPYAVSLSTDSERSQIVDLEDAALKPTGWDSLAKPALAAPEDIVLYELHLRDFSINDPSVPAADQGTYRAFTHTGSNGMTHLTNLATAGLTHLHLLPVFDIATIPEDPTDRLEPNITTPISAPDSEQPQEAIAAVQDQDGFNWGYDPFHYTVPEGSYSTDPNGSARLLEFREMVQALNQNGLRVVMDVVYNHTHASGQNPKSVLDKIVPGYYHRLDANGDVATSTCCQNTATEHNMMEKLMIDSVVAWATAYKVDGFRFDLMGHHMKSNMLAVRDALDALTIAADGVNGDEIYIYGEGWNFGEVESGQRGENATQFNMAGTGLGTFNDRLRDAVRGGGPFDGGQALLVNQGFINGLHYDTNTAAGGQDQLADLLLSADQIRVGLAGNLADYSFTDRNDQTVTGKDVDYNGSPAGYTQDPQEHIIYVSAHDNQTLFDISQYKHPTDTPMADRVRAQNLGIDLTMLAQGVPFFHAGVDMLRSKSMDRDSYNSGDWFNDLDFTYQTNNWGVGLPIEEVNGDNWPLMRPLLTDPALEPDQSHITATVKHMQEMLEIRGSSPLFRLETEQQIMDRLAFHNTGSGQIPGLIVMSLSDVGGPDLDPNYDGILVFFNAADEVQTVAAPAGFGAAATPELHPVQLTSSDSVVPIFDSGTETFTIPARTTAVFVAPQ